MNNIGDYLLPLKGAMELYQVYNIAEKDDVHSLK